MKKIISFILLMAFIFVFAGCSTNTAKQKSEEELRKELREEIKAELESEAKATVSEDNETQKESDNIYDLKAIYEFVKDSYEFKGFDEFKSNIEVEMLDVTWEGTEEAVLVNTLNMNSPIVFVTVDSGRFELIPSDLTSGKYNTSVSTFGEFIVVEAKTGGSGIQEEYFCLAVNTGEEIKMVLEPLVTKYTVAIPDVTCEGEGTINIKGNTYEEFFYNYNEFENDKHVKCTRADYKYNPDTLSFEITPDDSSFNLTQKEQ